MQSLPIDYFLEEISEKLNSHRCLVITAAPGAGKTTRLPPALLKKVSGKILVLEPRRMAAIAAADRIAEENNWQLGQEVGYQVRFENETTSSTRLIFMTEALLARQMLNDSELQGVDVVILDEFHERSLHVDLTLGLLKELQELGRDIKIIIMSATLHAEKISEYLNNAPVINVPGRLFEIEIHHQKQPQLLQTSQDFYQNLVATIKQAQQKTQKDILVFLPGVGEIEKTNQYLTEWAQQKNIIIQYLHGSLPLAEQRKALHPIKQQRVILSTNIAESSVTLDGVDTVIDSGLEKVMRQDHRTGFSRLELGRISLSSATQRAGRSGRQFPGRCFKLWNKHDELSMPKNEVPEIQRADLSEALLFLANHGVRHFQKFSWFESPTTQAIEKAQIFLQRIDALTNSNELTALGKKMLQFPAPPRIAKLLIQATHIQQIDLGADLAALLQEKDILKREVASHYLADHYECDFTLRWQLLTEYKNKKTSRDILTNLADTVLKTSQQLKKIAKASTQKEVSLSQDDIRKLLLHSYTDRLCRRRGQTDRALMVGGRGVKLASDSLVKKSEFFIALSGAEIGSDTETSIQYACGFDKNFLLNELKNDIVKKKELYFDKDKGALLAREARFVFDLPIDEPSISNPTSEQIENFLPDFLTENLDFVLLKNESLNKFIKRLKYADMNLSKEQIHNAFAAACVGVRNLNEILEKDLIYFFEYELGSNKTQDLKKNIPQKIQVPSGSWIEIFYPENQDPFIEVRIQEIFGWTETPKVLNDTKNIIIHLLGPNYRPVQVTSDLRSFWKNAYPEIRSELKIKYPKHSWPEDPFSAKPEAKGRPRK